MLEPRPHTVAVPRGVRGGVPGRRSPAGGPGRLYRDSYILVATEVRRCSVEDLGLPPLALRITQVHAQQVAREECGLLASLAGFDLEDDVLAIGRVAGNEQPLQPVLEFSPTPVELVGLRDKRGILGSQLTCCLAVGDRPLQLLVRNHD